VTPVLDVGCGAARHLLALAQRGIDGLGLDVTPSAVRLARSRGATVIEGSIFGPVPGSGTWRTALLLGGNVGIGGDPVALVVRVTAVLRPGGMILAELEAPGAGGRTERARVHHDVHTGPWFDWAVVDPVSIQATASDAGLDVVASWSAGGGSLSSRHRSMPAGLRRIEAPNE